MIRKILKPVRTIALYPYPSSGGGLARHNLLFVLRCAPGSQVEPLEREWRRFVKLVAGMSGLRDKVSESLPRQADVSMHCYFYEPKPRVGFILREPEDVMRLRIADFYDRLRRIAKWREWEIRDLAALQARLDIAAQKLSDRGFKAPIGMVDELHAVGVTCGVHFHDHGSVRISRDLTVKRAIELVLEHASYGRRTIEEVEHFASDDYATSKMFIEAMKRLGFRPSKRGKGQWARIK